MKVFYSHLIILDDLLSELDAHEIEAGEKADMVMLIEQTMHHHTLNVILSHLPKSHHTTFLDKFEANPENEELMAMLKKEIEADVEVAIKNQVDRIKKEILLEIRRSKRA